MVSNYNYRSSFQNRLYASIAFEELCLLQYYIEIEIKGGREREREAGVSKCFRSSFVFRVFPEDAADIPASNGYTFHTGNTAMMP